ARRWARARRDGSGRTTQPGLLAAPGRAAVGARAAEWPPGPAAAPAGAPGRGGRRSGRSVRRGGASRRAAVARSPAREGTSVAPQPLLHRAAHGIVAEVLEEVARPAVVARDLERDHLDPALLGLLLRFLHQ